MTNVRDINAACRRCAESRNRGQYVYATLVDGTTPRIVKARRRNGILQVYLLATGKWEPATRVYEA